MHIITRRTLTRFAERHGDVSDAIDRWYRLAKSADWQSIQQVRETFPTADGVAVASGDTMTVFNIGGNRYRLIVFMPFVNNRVYVKALLTHAEYSKDRWKDHL